MEQMTEKQLTEREKREITKRNAQLVRLSYERLLTEYEAATNSRGMVATWGRVGGRSNKIARPTQDRALAAMAFEEHMRETMGWFECIRGTVRRLNAREGKSLILRRRHVMLARVLQLYVFEKADAEDLIMNLSSQRRVSRQYAGRMLREALDEVMKDAETLGLFDQPGETARGGPTPQGRQSMG